MIPAVQTPFAGARRRRYLIPAAITGASCVALVGGAICSLGIMEAGAALGRAQTLNDPALAPLRAPPALGPRAAARPPSTDTTSTSLPTAAERIAFLARYVKLHSPIEDAAFHIVYHDNGFAPSDWDMRVAVRVRPGGVAAWLSEARRHDGPAAFEVAGIVPPSWTLHGPGVPYRRPGTSLVVFEADRVIVMHLATM
jgi:hypothetical protein